MKPKVNYDKLLQEEVAKLDYVPKLLLHSCCAPCSSRVIEYLTNYFDITITDSQGVYTWKHASLKNY